MDRHQVPLPTTVRAFNESTKCFEKRMDGKRINFRNSSDRKWLMNSLMWALNNGVTVTLSADSN